MWIKIITGLGQNQEKNSTYWSGAKKSPAHMEGVRGTFEGGSRSGQKTVRPGPRVEDKDPNSIHHETQKG